MKNKRIVIWVCLGVISCVWLASGYSKVEPRQTVSEGKSGSGEQPDESAFEFNLDIYLGTEIAEEPSKIPDGHTLMRKDDRLFLAQSQPVLTESDLRDVRHTGAGIFVFELAESAVGKLQTLTEQNIGEHLVIVLNDEVLAAVPIEEKMADGQFSIPAEGLTEHQAEWLAGYRILPFFRRFMRAGVWNQWREGGHRMIEKDYAAAAELYTAALRNVKNDACLALLMRSHIIMCHRASGDVSKGTTVGAVAVATDALPNAMEVLRAQEDPSWRLDPDCFLQVARTLILWKEDASRAELSQALALAQYAAHKASAMVRDAQRDGQEHSARSYQHMARSARIYAARAKARVGSAATANRELEKVIDECDSPYELAHAKYCLGKTLVEYRMPQKGAQLLGQALAHLDASILDYPAAKWMREDVKRLLAAMGEAVDERPPEIIPGTAKIIVTARFADGAKPLGAECRLQTYYQAQPRPGMRDSQGELVPPTVIGADGDWVIYNVPAGRWAVEVRGDDFAFTNEANLRQPVEVRAGEEKLLTFTLLRGGTVSGRVLDIDSGKAIPGVIVTARQPAQLGLPTDAASPWCDITDAEGRYTLRHVRPGEVAPVAQAEGYAPMRSERVQVEDEGAVTAPDIRLRRGGWISGHVVRPEDVPQGHQLWGRVKPRFEGEHPRDVVFLYARVREDNNLRFRLGPVPPGLYTVEANVDTGKLSTKRWHGEVKGIWVQVAKETRDVVIEVTPESE